MRRETAAYGLALVLIGSAPSVTLGVEVSPRISDREIIERLSRLEEGQKQLQILMDQRFKAVDQRFEAIDQRFESIDQRFESMGQSVNQRFDAIDRRFDDLKWFFGTMIGVLMVINSAVLGFVLRRQGAMERSLETVRDEIAFLKSIVERLLPSKHPV